MQEHGGRSSSARELAAAEHGAATTPCAHDAEGIGRWLRHRREAFGLTVAEVSRALKLRASYIEAMEAEAFGDLPGRTYTAGYVRSLALALALDPDEAATRLRAAWPPDVATGTPSPPFAHAAGERRFPMSVVLSLSLAVAVAAYAYWYMNQSAEMGRPLLSPVAELEAEPDPMVAERPEVQPPAPGPLQLLGVPELAQSLDATNAIGRSADAVQMAKANLIALPAGPFPRPRPGTDAAAQFAAIYVPAPAYEGEPSADSTARAGGLPEASSLAAYLPAIGLRADLGPLRSGVQLPAIALAANSAGNADQQAVAAPAGRTTQAFAAVPPSALPMRPIGEAAGKRGGNVDGAAYDPMASLARTEPQDSASLVPITILADAPCWIEIHTAGGEVLIQRLLEPGERLDVPSQPGLTLTAGNAGGIRILVDGVTAAAVGGIGQVVRGVSLNPYRLLALR